MFPLAGCLLRVALREAISLLRSYQLGKSTGATNIHMPVIHTKLSDFIQTTKFRKYPIFISGVALLVDGKYYNQFIIPYNQIISQIYYIKFPCELKVGEKIQVNFSKQALKKEMLSLNPTEPIKIVITDTGNKQIIKSTDKTVRNIID